MWQEHPRKVEEPIEAEQGDLYTTWPSWPEPYPMACGDLSHRGDPIPAVVLRAMPPGGPGSRGTQQAPAPSLPLHGLHLAPKSAGLLPCLFGLVLLLLQELHLLLKSKHTHTPVA